MARLQDFQSVTPTASDKLLVVQSQGQGLVPYGSKLDTANPTGTGALSLNRKANTTTGTNSVAVGYNTTASGNYSFAEGNGTTASGNYGSHSEGSATIASGDATHAEGNSTTASGNYSHAQGMGTIAQRASQHVFGQFNVADTGGTGTATRGTYAEIVGKGTADNARSNARTLDWSGNEVLAGGLKINGTTDVRGITRFTLPKNSSKTVTVSKDNTIVGFYVSAIGNIGVLNSFLFYVAGYATASRCNVINLLNISGATAFSITATNTSDTIFTFANSSTTNDAEVALIPIFGNKFTIT